MTTRAQEKKVIPKAVGPLHTTGFIMPKKDPKKDILKGPGFDFNVHVTQTLVMVFGAILVYYLIKSKF